MKRLFKKFLFSVLNFIVFFSKIKKIDMVSEPIVILLKKPLGIGDLVMLSPFVELLAKSFKDNHLYIISEYDKFIEMENVIWLKPSEVKKNILRESLVISPTLTFRHFKYIFSSKHFIGYFISNKLISNIKRFNYSYDPKKEHYLEKVFPILDALKVEYNSNSFLYPSPLLDSGFHMNEKYVTVAPYSNWNERQYPKEDYINLIKLISNDFNIRVVLIGSKSTSEMCFNNQIKQECSSKFVVDMTGKTSIFEMNSIIKNGILFIGNDSGPSHIAYILAKKSLVFFGSVSFENRLPRNKQLIANIIALDSRQLCGYFPCYDGYNKPNCRNFPRYSCLSNIRVSKAFLKELLRCHE